MSKIVGIGACVMDTLYNIPSFPKEDTKLRATGSKIAGGGPTATGLVAARKLGVSAAYLGVLSEDSSGVFLRQDFEKYGVDTGLIETRAGFRSFSSVIWLSADSASRTCVFDRGNLPALVLTEGHRQAISDAEILMVDGNELDAAVEAAQLARACGTRVLYDCGGLYPGVERLLRFTDIMIPSEEFALAHTGCANAEDAAERLYRLYSPEVVVITQGKAGGLIYDGGELRRYPAFPVQAVDTNGSGDVFHGAFAAGLVKGFDFDRCCRFASAVSALKCTGIGARESVPDFDTVKKFLEVNGYDL